jgi:DNA-binding NarL/FixJ family response regulator
MLMSSFIPEVEPIPGQPRHALRILIADDSEMIRQAMISILRSRPTWEVCGEASDGADAIQKAVSLRPDVVLLDISMPGKNGLEVARMIRQQIPEVKILIVSLNDAALMLPSARAAGADGCIGKDRLITDLVPAIEAFEPGQTAEAL